MKFLFSGIKSYNDIPHLILTSESNGDRVEVPIDQVTADRISKYLSRISPPAPQMERLNDQESEE